MPEVKKLIFKNFLSPGDVLCMTAALYSLHRAFPGAYKTAVDTSCQALWEHNPDVSPLAEAQAEGDWQVLPMQYNVVNQSNQRAIHVLDGYCQDLENHLGVHVPLFTNKPLLFLSAQERSWLNQVAQETGRQVKFWVVNAGFKNCFTAKYWPFYQEVVDRLQGKVQFVQVGKKEHNHQPLRGVIDLLDKTDDRQLIRLISHAEGVLCGLTFTMHLAAAFQKPAVILAGGREPKQWNTYANQILLNNVGQLPCCKTEACWKSRTVRLGDGAEADAPDKLCACPVMTPIPSPRCMALIAPDEVVRAILSYYEGGVLNF